jgi:diguanylate cyclase (GGDEF)-like protein/PAS domain S-box-containing protein
VSGVFHSIGNRLLLLVGAVVVVGMVGLVLIYTDRQEATIFRENEQALQKVADSVAEGLSALMLKGHAKAAEEFAQRLKTVPNIVDYRIIRVDGTEAFVDNATVDAVNDRLGDLEFFGRKKSPPPTVVLAPSDPTLVRARRERRSVISYDTLPGGERLVTILGPIRAQDGCERCHGPVDGPRGFIKLTTSLKAIDGDIQRTRNLALLFIAVGLVLIVSAIYWFARRTVVDHIVSINRAMATAATGDLTQRLSERKGDEIGFMARSFNRMSDELLQIYAGLRDERSKLTTIIRGADSGIVVTDSEQQIVLVNPSACKMLGKDEAQVVRDGLMATLDDPEWLAAEFNRQAWDPKPALLQRGKQMLSVQASVIRDAGGAMIGSAVLLRDVTREKALEETLRRESITDALTGLYNRRHFDETITAEFKRWQRYQQPFSIIMVDIDHFKKFNDTHGHECGDRVLAAIGKVLGNISTHLSVACRYGGEELVVILPGSVESAAAGLAEALRQAVAALMIDGMGVTASFGVAGVPGHRVEDGNALLRLADDALYRAKASGRNRVCVAAAEGSGDPVA